MMKGIIIFIETSSHYAQEKVFAGKSAVECSYEWAEKLLLPVFTVSENQSEYDVLCKMSEICENENADYALVSFNDTPFTDVELVQELTKNHVEYKSEYTFADGYPYGFCPDAIDSGILKILAAKIKDDDKTEFLKRNFLYELIKKDINSYEVETILSETDWRLFRFNFSAEKKETFTACKNLFSELNGQKLSAEKTAALAASSPSVLKVLPGFYNIQICGYEEKTLYSPYKSEYEKKFLKSPEKSPSEIMKTEKVLELVKRISEFSENAVIGLSAFGECFSHPDIIKIIEEIIKHEGLCVFAETDGLSFTDEIVLNLKNLYEKYPQKKNAFPKIMIAVKLDAVSEDFYKKIHPECADGDFAKAFSAAQNLANALPGCVYPQFVRMQQNEDELESFFRFWNEKNGGNLIIQKYDDFAGLLPQYKVADLSPVERNVCWHLRRDLTVLLNGDVPLCHSCVFSNVIGNVWESSLEEIWKKLDSVILEHINKKYNEKCGKCDEYYTFNF